jgi:hypothetical protein
MDHLDIPNLHNLQSLDLKHVKISSTRLLAILRNCASTLNGLILEGVELKCGTWADIFTELCQHDNLRVFHVMGGCSYANDGISAHWASRRARHRARQTESSSLVGEKDILTSFWGDEPALGSLQRKVLANRALLGLQGIGEDMYKYMLKEPLRAG